MEYPDRKQNCLSGYDYSQSGAYFITICTKAHENRFGRIEDEKMILNELGLIVQDNWLSIPVHFEEVILDEFVIMPNHIHGIIMLGFGNGYIRSLHFVVYIYL